MLAEGSFDNFRKSIAKMESSEVFRDPHIGQLLVFHPCTDLHEYWMVEQGYLLLQDKVIIKVTLLKLLILLWLDLNSKTVVGT